MTPFDPTDGRISVRVVACHCVTVFAVPDPPLVSGRERDTSLLLPVRAKARKLSDHLV